MLFIDHFERNARFGCIARCTVPQGKKKKTIKNIFFVLLFVNLRVCQIRGGGVIPVTHTYLHTFYGLLFLL